MIDIRSVLAYILDLAFIGGLFIVYLFLWYFLPFFVGWTLVKFLLTGSWL